MRYFRGLFLAAALLTAMGQSACSPPSASEIRLERSIFQQVHDNKIADVEAHLPAAEQNNAEVHAAFVQLQRDYVPAAAPTRIDQLQWGVTKVSGGDRTISSVDQYVYPDRVLVVSTIIEISSSGPYVLRGFHINMASAASVANASNASFSLAGKPLHQLIYFGVFATVLVSMLATIGCVIFTKGFKRKWLWVIVALFGFPVYTMNWATGIWGPNFQFGLIDAGVTRGSSVLDPWIVTFHVPVGAMIAMFFVVRRWMGYGPDE